MRPSSSGGQSGCLLSSGSRVRILPGKMDEIPDRGCHGNLQQYLSRLGLLIIDELGDVPPSPTGAELLFEVFSQRCERGSILVTLNLPFDEWTDVFGSEGAPARCWIVSPTTCVSWR